jgi:hypothetical protein
MLVTAFLAATGPGALAQSPVVPGVNVPAVGSPPSAPIAPAVSPAAPEGTPAGAECSCGDRHGLSRWWWHHRVCKRHLQEHALGYLEEFNEWPLGASLYAHGRTQVANGLAAQQVFYAYDFVEETGRLNTRGQDKLARIAAELPASCHPVIVERTPANPALAESRRMTVLAELGKFPFPVPPERIVVGAPISIGLDGEEANVLYGNQLQFLRGGGAALGGGAGTAGLDSSGLSGGATFGH